MVAAIEPAVALYEEPPTEPLLVETPWGDVRITAAEWAEAFDSPDPGTPHNLARDDVWDEVLTILADKLDVRRALPRRLPDASSTGTAGCATPSTARGR